MARSDQEEPPPLDISEQPLPGNESVERLVLGSVLGDEDTLLSVLDSVTEEDFQAKKHKVIFARIKQLAQDGTKVDQVTLCEALIANRQLQAVDGLSYIAGLSTGSKLVNLSDYIKILKDKAKLRALIALGNSLVASGMDPAAKPAQIVETLDKQIYRTFAISAKPKVEKLSSFIDRTPFLNLLHPREVGPGLYTGYRKLDEATDGLHEGQIMLAGGATSTGKSSIVIQVAMNNATQGIPVVIYSLEMPKHDLYNRFLCQEARVPLMRFRAGEVSKEEQKRLLDANLFIHGLPIYIDDSPALTPAEMMMRTKRAKEHEGVEIALLDYVQMMRADYARGSMFDKLTEICDSLKVIAKETVPLLVFSQLSQEHRKTGVKPSVNDYKGGAMIGEMAQVAFQIFRPDMERGKKDPALRGKAEFILVKNRDGELKTIPMKYVGWRMRFEDVDPADQALIDY